APIEETAPQRPLITVALYLGIHQVSRGQFRHFLDATGYKAEGEKDGKGGWGWVAAANKWVQDPKFTWRSPGFDQTDDHPVVNVSWNDTMAFCGWLSLQDSQTYGLPTEGEWGRAWGGRHSTGVWGGEVTYWWR